MWSCVTITWILYENRHSRDRIFWSQGTTVKSATRTASILSWWVNSRNLVKQRVVMISNMGLSENRLNPYTQWFCWSDFPTKWLLLGVYPIFRHTHMSIWMIISLNSSTHILSNQYLIMLCIDASYTFPAEDREFFSKDHRAPFFPVSVREKNAARSFATLAAPRTWMPPRYIHQGVATGNWESYGLD